VLLLSENDILDPKKLLPFRIAIIILYFIILTITLIVLIDVNAEIHVIGLIVLFLTLLFLGIILKRRKSILSVRLLYGDKEKLKQRKKDPKKDKIISLDYTYHKPLIRKCSNCGTIVPTFAKKCPVCGEEII